MFGTAAFRYNNAIMRKTILVGAATLALAMLVVRDAGAIQGVQDSGPVRSNVLSLLRPGAVTPEMLCALCPGLRLDDCSMRKLKDGEKPMAPGMKYRHYAPRAQVILLDGERELILSFLKEAAADSSVGVITDGTDMEAVAEPERRFSLGRRENPAELAAHLFSALREIDRHPSIKTVYAAMPEKDGIGLAVYNRMMKASGFTVRKL